jgi:dCTP deaminase
MVASLLSTQELRSRLLDHQSGFLVTPMPAFSDVKLGSINLSLGSSFLLARRASVPFLEAGKAQRSRAAFLEVRLAADEMLILQPQQFALASTREYLCLPANLGAQIQSRSTYGRMGLIAATATYVTPGYKGCPTLEIVNAGEVPVGIKPGEQICQLIPQTADEAETDLTPSRYQCAVRPYAARPKR